MDHLQPAAMTTQMFMATYQIGRTKLWREIKERRLRAVKLGKKTLIMREDAAAWAASLPANREP